MTKKNKQKQEEQKKQEEQIRMMEVVRRQCEEDEHLAKRTLYADFLTNKPIRKKCILYEAYSGRGLICNPYAIFRELLSRKKFKKYTHVWVLDGMEEYKDLIDEYAPYDNVKFVEFESDEYLEYLATAKYLINNMSFRGYFTKRKGQIYVNTWHGIPLKSLGYQIPGGNISAGNAVKNLLMADYLISPNNFMTDVYKKSFRLDGIFEGRILQIGQPRNDRGFYVSREEVILKLKKMGVEIDSGKKIILYAPTWKGQEYRNPDTGLEIYFELIKRVEHILGEEYQVIVKPHQIVYKAIKDRKDITKQFIPVTMDTNELLAAVDVLISDYSSIYFDFLVSERPVLFFVPDLEDYINSRGLYFGIDKLPGPIACNFEELEKILYDIDAAMKPHWEKYRQEKQWACGMDDGKVCRRVVGIVFLKRLSRRKISCRRNDKIKLLLYGGPLITNGITISFLTLLEYIDYSKFDVTVLVDGKHTRETAERINQMPKEVRVLRCATPYCATQRENANHMIVMEQGIEAGDRCVGAFYQRELYRLVGESKFDYAIEFSGYSRMYSLLFAHFRGGKKFIWMHNDLKRELDRAKKGGLDVGKSLKVCFSTYPYMDKIVGCSKSIRDINEKNFTNAGTRNKFFYARNLINEKRVRMWEKKENCITIGERDYYIIERSENEEVSVKMSVLPIAESDNINFVTMGRLSPEKNQENLIHAFAKLYRENPKIRLFILGEGPLRSRLEDLLIQEEIDAVVKMPGVLPEPFGFMKQCQCFILPSNYEGQPLVVQEARVLGLPIIVSHFDSVEDVLIEGGQLLIGQSEEEIYDGMKKFINGEVPVRSFDVQQYNEQVYREFEQLFI